MIETLTNLIDEGRASPGDLADAARCSESSVYRWRTAGKLRYDHAVDLCRSGREWAAELHAAALNDLQPPEPPDPGRLPELAERIVSLAGRIACAALTRLAGRWGEPIEPVVRRLCVTAHQIARLL